MSLSLPLSRTSFVINVRTQSAPLSGVQRYVRELDARFDPAVERLAPASPAQGPAGHLWEQFILPARCRGRLLFSPGNTGPCLHRRQIVTIHDAATFDCASAFTGAFGRWYRWLLPQLARRVAGVITVSEFSRDRLVAALGIHPGRIAVVHNGVTRPTTAPDAAMLRETRARLQLPEKFLLFVGSRDPRKNLERLVAAFAQAELNDISLVIAGGGNPQLYRASLPAAPLDRIRRLGHVSDSDLEVLYRLATAFVFPSVYEGFGLPPLEAMARGCPVLCADSSCLPEVCGRSLERGGACLYFSPLRVEAIAACLRSFGELPAAARQTMVEAGYRQAAKFSWDRCARETIEAIDRLSGATLAETGDMPARERTA